MPALSPKTKKALLLGGLCVASYLPVDLARNTLSSFSPQMKEAGVLPETRLSAFSSALFFAYAIGQLLNGILGDRIPPKWMVGGGLILGGGALAAFYFTLPALFPAVVFYGAMGFFLSMVYAPMTRLTVDQVDQKEATRCVTAYSFASVFGAPLAGVMAGVMTWQSGMKTSFSVLLVTGSLFLALILFWEKRNFLSAPKKAVPGKKTGFLAAFPELVRRKILLYTLFIALVGIARTAAAFWMPNFLSAHLGFSSDQSAWIFSVATVVASSGAFLPTFLYEWTGRKMKPIIAGSFLLSTLSFLIAALASFPWAGVVAYTLGLFFATSSTALIWTVYTPTLADTGAVSGATGFLDFISYMAASLSSSLFGTIVQDHGWQALLFLLFGIMGVGTLSSAALFLPGKKRS